MIHTDGTSFEGTAAGAGPHVVGHFDPSPGQSSVGRVEVQVNGMTEIGSFVQTFRANYAKRGGVLLLNQVESSPPLAVGDLLGVTAGIDASATGTEIEVTWNGVDNVEASVAGTIEVRGQA